MKEDFLHYIWSHELFHKTGIAISGEKIEIISPGTKNTDAGPDFYNARIKIDNTIWAGNVEIHTDSSNWINHKHNKDSAYDNVILHVVQNFTKESFRSNGEMIPTLEIKYDKNLFEKYEKLVSSNKNIPCDSEIKLVNPMQINMWIESLGIERLEQKTQFIDSLLKTTKNNWEETFYIVLARSFGFNTNALPFELLAKTTPLKVLSKYRNNLFQLEALLFGQAGFLSKTGIEDEYYCKLQNEYQHFKNTYKLKPIKEYLWKFLRLRPSNFPTIRIAQFAWLIHQTNNLFSKILETGSIQQLSELFDCKAGEYWDTHYNFTTVSKYKIKVLGKYAVDSILINTIIPFLFIFGQKRNIESLQDKAIAFLENLPAEKNAIIRKWSELNILPENSLQSQALIYLTKNYCNQKNCVYCQIGSEIIRAKNK